MCHHQHTRGTAAARLSMGRLTEEEGQMTQRLEGQTPGAAVAAVLAQMPRRIVACSGGVDSLLLAYLAHRGTGRTVVAHAVTPAVPPSATARVMAAADQHGWELHVVTSDEFADERYLSNPQDRCYFCKTNLYDELGRLSAALASEARASDGGASAAGASDGGGVDGWTLLSGANIDDLAEYRPGLVAAAEHEVRHPYVEAGVTKDGIRAQALAEGLDWATLPAAPCLASRLYTGTRVTELRLRAVDVGEELIRQSTGVAVVRCRLRDDAVLIEVPVDARPLITAAVVSAVAVAMQSVAPELVSVALDSAPYAPGRSFLPIAEPVA
ncbi:MAG: hypothetical protein ACJA2H_001123 [Nitriliruptoraceae bacterium]|jgi:uncharacterized protein